MRNLNNTGETGVPGAAGDVPSVGEAKMHLCLWESRSTDPGYLCSCSTRCSGKARWLQFSATRSAVSKYKDRQDLRLKLFRREREDLSRRPFVQRM